MGPPVSQVGWSPEIVGQSLEVLPLGLGANGMVWLKPVHAASLKVGLPLDREPSDAVLDVLGWYDLRAKVVHSTSWRREDARVILTYVAVIEEPDLLPLDSLVVLPVKRTDLARGGATRAPAAIGVDAVVEHALRHLAWLLREDAAIADALPGWSALLRDYGPEPFQALS